MSLDQAATLLLAHLHLSLLSVGGAMTLAPELHRLLVTEHGWISGEAFSRCVTLAQALPGPNVLYIALLGWQVGQAAAPAGAGLAGAWSSGALGLACSLVGVLLPSSLLACAAAQLQQRRAGHRIVQAFRAGMAPVIVAVLLGSAWVVGQGAGVTSGGLQAPALAVLTAAAMAYTRVHLLWFLLIGALVGAWTGANGIGPV